MEIPKTILSQLGGKSFINATGAKNFVGTSDSLRFQIPNSNIKWVKVKLMLDDTYTMEFIDKNGVAQTELEEIYCDQLTSFFTAYTGLITFNMTANYGQL